MSKTKITGERAYIDLMQDVLLCGNIKKQRAKLSDGSIPLTKSLFGEQIRFDISHYFPLMTSKYVSFNIVAHELIWFLRGEESIRYLKENNVHIWDKFADKYGNVYNGYPTQWRYFGGYSEYEDTCDQIENLIRNIKNCIVDPNHKSARRLIITSWNPVKIEKPETTAPVGCHTLAQFYLNEGELSCQVYMRSADLFLGVPYNVANYALLTRVICHLLNLKSKDLVFSFGDVHVYENHFDQCENQIERFYTKPIAFPTLEISSNLVNIEKLSINNFSIYRYQNQGLLPGEVAV